MLLTNKTAVTPLGFGPLGITIEPGQSATVTAEQFAQLEAHPVIAGWIAEGKLGVEAEAKRLEAEAARLAEAKRLEAEAARLAERKKQDALKLEPPKVPVPTPGKAR